MPLLRSSNLFFTLMISMFTTVRKLISAYPISFLGLALAIALLLKAVFTFEDMPLWMFPSGAGSEPSENQGKVEK